MEQSRIDVWKMFDRISPRYDLVNRVLSFGIDIYWRRQVAKYLPATPSIDLLDLATGTGDQMLSLVNQIKSGLGIDMSEEMLKLGARKASKKGHADKLSFLRGDATAISLPEEAVDAVTMSFGIRNVTDVSLCMQEMHRVLRPSGRTLILEFSLPKNRLIRAAHLFYLRKVLPAVGGFISGNKEAYRYLNSTIETFPYGAEFCKLLEEAGFERARAIPLSFGIATLYVGEKGDGST